MPAMTLRLLIQATKMPLITIRPTAADLAIAKAVAAHTNPPEEVAEALTVGTRTFCSPLPQPPGFHSRGTGARLSCGLRETTP